MVNNFPVKNISRTKFAFTTFTQISAVLFLAPVLLGLIGIVLPAAGYLPALGRFDFSWAPFQEFLNTPGLQKSIWLSLKTGLLATLTSLVGCFMLLVTFSENKHTSKIRWALAPLVYTSRYYRNWAFVFGAIWLAYPPPG